MSTDAPLQRPRPFHSGPPLALLAAVSVVLLVASLVVSAALGGVIPSPYADAQTIQDHFRDEADAVKAGAVLVFASAVPLSIYAAAASSRLRRLGMTAPGGTIALVGGVLSAGALSLSGLLLWTLARPAVRTDAPLVRALHDLSFLTGGVAHVVFLGLLVAGIAVPSLIMGLLPRPLAWTGLVIAVLAEVTTLALIRPGLAVLLPIARFASFVWLIVAGHRLPLRNPGSRANRPRPLDTDAAAHAPDDHAA